jgi:hypothetical protein
VPVLTDGTHIIWIIGVATSETTRIDDRTRRIVRITVEQT